MIMKMYFKCYIACDRHPAGILSVQVFLDVSGVIDATALVILWQKSCRLLILVQYNMTLTYLHINNLRGWSNLADKRAKEWATLTDPNSYEFFVGNSVMDVHKCGAQSCWKTHSSCSCGSA
jgi:hypothetical protein